MNDLDLLRKKTGMTIAKAWILMMTGIIVFLLSVGIVGIVAGFKKNDFNDVEIVVFPALLGILLLCCVWGFFINKKQLPFFKKTSLAIALVCFLVMLSWFYVNPILYDLFPYDNKSTPKDSFGYSFLETMLSLALTTLQVGFIGHGLLKNYFFTQVLFTVAAMSIVFVIPQAVFGIAIETLIVFYVYYRTASFQLPILMIVIFSILELFFKRVLEINTSNNNYIRTQLLQNNTLYYIGTAIGLSIIMGGLYYIKKQTTPIEWQRPDEDKNLTFL